MCDHSNLLYIISHQSKSWSLDIISTYRHCQSFLVQIPPSAAFWIVMKMECAPKHKVMISFSREFGDDLLVEDSTSSCLNTGPSNKRRGMKLIFRLAMIFLSTSPNGIQRMVALPESSEYPSVFEKYHPSPPISSQNVSWALFGIMSSLLIFLPFFTVGNDITR